MKKIITVIAASLAFVAAAQAQPAFTVLQQLDTVYEDMKVFSPTYIAGLRNNSSSMVIDLRTNTGTDFGTIVRQVPIGDPTSSFEHLEPIGNVIYACGYYNQAIDLTNPAAPAYGPVMYFGYLAGAGHYSNMLYLMTETFSNNVIKAYSLTNALNPALVDSLVLPRDGSFSIWQNKLFYAQSDSALGHRVFNYTLSNTAPYFTSNPVFTIAPSVPYDIPATEVAGNHLLVKTRDTLYDLGIGGSGALTISRKHSTPAINATTIVAHDTTVLCYAGRQRIDAQSLNNGALRLVDTTDQLSFNSIRHIAKLGNNIYYTTLMTMKLIRFGSAPSSVRNNVREDDRFHIYPNPASQQWTIDSKASATFTLFGSDGKLMQTKLLEANSRQIISANQLATGHYFYRIIAADGMVSTGKLLKNN